MLNKLRLAAMAFAATLLVPATTHAEPTSTELKQALNADGASSRQAAVVLQTYYNAFLWSNAYVENMTNKKGHIYCPPRKIIMQEPQVRSIFLEFLDKNADKADLPAGAVILIALQDAFVCDEAYSAQE